MMFNLSVCLSNITTSCNKKNNIISTNFIQKELKDLAEQKDFKDQESLEDTLREKYNNIIIFDSLEEAPSTQKEDHLQKDIYLNKEKVSYNIKYKLEENYVLKENNSLIFNQAFFILKDPIINFENLNDDIIKIEIKENQELEFKINIINDNKEDELFICSDPSDHYSSNLIKENDQSNNYLLSLKGTKEIKENYEEVLILSYNRVYRTIFIVVNKANDYYWKEAENDIKKQLDKIKIEQKNNFNTIGDVEKYLKKQVFFYERIKVEKIDLIEEIKNNKNINLNEDIDLRHIKFRIYFIGTNGCFIKDKEKAIIEFEFDIQPISTIGFIDLQKVYAIDNDKNRNVLVNFKVYAKNNKKLEIRNLTDNFEIGKLEEKGESENWEFFQLPLILKKTGLAKIKIKCEEKEIEKEFEIKNYNYIYWFVFDQEAKEKFKNPYDSMDKARNEIRNFLNEKKLKIKDNGKPKETEIENKNGISKIKFEMTLVPIDEFHKIKNINSFSSNEFYVNEEFEKKFEIIVQVKVDINIEVFYSEKKIDLQNDFEVAVESDYELIINVLNKELNENATLIIHSNDNVNVEVKNVEQIQDTSKYKVKISFKSFLNTDKAKIFFNFGNLEKEMKVKSNNKIIDISLVMHFIVHIDFKKGQLEKGKLKETAIYIQKTLNDKFKNELNCSVEHEDNDCGMFYFTLTAKNDYIFYLKDKILPHNEKGFQKEIKTTVHYK